MSIYDKETSKIYPDLSPSLPSTTRVTNILLKKSTEIEAYLLAEIEVLERLVKKMKQNKIAIVLATGLKTSTVITEGASIAAFPFSTGLPVEIGSRGTRIFFSVATVITRKNFKIFTIKQEKDDVINLPAQGKVA